MPDPKESADTFGEDPVPRDDAPQIPGEFGVDADPYTEDDSKGQESPRLPEPRENEPDA